MAKKKTALRKGERVKVVERSGNATPVGIGRLMSAAKVVSGTFVAAPTSRKKTKKRKAKRKAT